MTLTAERPAAEAASTRAAADPRRLYRRWRVVAVVLGVVVIVAFVLAFLAGSDSRRTFDPTSPSHQGSLAISRLLADRGVTVRLDTALPASPGGTVLVPDADLMSDADLHRLALLARTLPVVLAGADESELDPMGIDAGTDGTDYRTRQPDCTLPAAVVAGSARLGVGSYALDRAANGLRLTDSCYGDGDAPTLLRFAGSGGGSLTLLGTGSFLRDDQLGHDGDAALALGLLGTEPTVDWVLPTSSQAGDERPGTPLSQVLPRGVLFGSGELLVVIALLALWRGRRLGPVVREPLPVVVRAVETVRGRARLYRAGSARDRASLALREAARARLAAALGMGAGTTAPALVDAVAARTGRPRAAVAALLYGPTAPTDDDALVALADDLDLLAAGLRPAAPPARSTDTEGRPR